jgi:hypothetical protein
MTPKRTLRRNVFVGLAACWISAVAFAEVLELEGTVEAVDLKARTITIEREAAKGTKTLELEVTKKAGNLSSVKAGDSISFSYDPDLELVTKIAKQRNRAAKVDVSSEEQLARLSLDTLLLALEANDYDRFVANLTAGFQATLTKQKIEGISNQLAPRMKKGYDVIALGQLKERGFTVYLWKLVYRDDGDDTLVRLVLWDGKVTGFLITSPMFQ